MPNSAPTPEELVARIVDGDGEAETLLVARYERPLRAMLRRRLREAADVDDFAQTALQLVIEKVRGGEVRKPEGLGGFVMALGRNLVIEHFRRHARRKTEADDEKVATFPSSEPSIDSRLVASERAEMVRDLLAELGTARDREVLRRFYLEDEDKESICRVLDLSSLHFNRVLHRARQRYRQIFEARIGTEWNERAVERLGAHG